MADVLFGKVEPSGRLTTTFPRNVGQVPFYYNHYNTGRPGFGDYKGNYVDVPTTPLYPFGFGLAYTTFLFGKTQVSADSVPLDGKFTVRTQIKNSGARRATAVAELHSRAGRQDRPPAGARAQGISENFPATRRIARSEFRPLRPATGLIRHQRSLAR